jgi:hypothetical protein
MIVQTYLVIRRTGSVKVVTRQPSLGGNEIAVRLAIEIPNTLFERPQLEANLKIPTEAIPKGKITTSVTDNVEKLIKEATGLTMKVTVVEQEKVSDKK